MPASEFYFLTLLLYQCLLFYFNWNWSKGRERYTAKAAKHDFSIIIPFRNETENLILLCATLLMQMKENDELILVDDHSENGLAERLTSSFGKDSRFRLLFLGDAESGKKKALAKAVNASLRKKIIQLDADVQLGDKWRIAVEQSIHDADLTILPLCLNQLPGRLFKLENTEMMALSGISGAMASAGRPVLSNGANLCIDRKLMEEFIRSGKGSQLSSGDDQFLLSFAKEHDYRINWAFHPLGIAITKGSKSLKAYVDQRVRWASKMGASGMNSGKMLGALMIFFQILFVISMLYFLIQKDLQKFFIFLFAKGFAEYLFTRAIARFFGQHDWLSNFSYLGVLVYPFLSIFTAVASLFYKPKWKGRRIKTQ